MTTGDFYLVLLYSGLYTFQHWLIVNAAETFVIAAKILK